jgi:hypothetical protein
MIKGNGPQKAQEIIGTIDSFVLLVSFFVPFVVVLLSLDKAPLISLTFRSGGVDDSAQKPDFLRKFHVT